MAEPYYASPTGARRTFPTRALAGFGLGAMLLGGVAIWALSGAPGWPTTGLFELDQGTQTAESQPEPEPLFTPPPTADAPPAAAAQVERMAQQQGGIDQRVAAMEQRLARLDLQAQAAAGNAARAESLLVTFAARRSIERGVPLGYLADQLQLRFGDAQPNAVRTVIEASRDPITLDRLVARLDGLASSLVKPPPAEGPVSWLSRELSELFVVRRENSPSPEPKLRLERARMFLESGRTEAAISEVRNLPNPAGAAGWIADAERYAQAERALELLETAALLEPRDLRDGAGRSVAQVSPLAGE